MNHSINLFPLFAKNLCVGNLGCEFFEIDIIQKIVKKEKFQDLNNVKDEYIRGDNLCETSSSYYILEHDAFLFLKDKLLKYINEFFKKTLHYDKNKFVITTSWISKTSPNKESHWHNHNNCYYSGVYYVDVHKNCGDILFNTFTPDFFALEASKTNQYNSRMFSIPVENDRIILFPSQIYHKISKNNSNKDRYCIAFNIMPVGKIGTNDSCLIYNL